MKLWKGVILPSEQNQFLISKYIANKGSMAYTKPLFYHKACIKQYTIQKCTIQDSNNYTQNVWEICMFIHRKV